MDDGTSIYRDEADTDSFVSSGYKSIQDTSSVISDPPSDCTLTAPYTNDDVIYEGNVIQESENRYTFESGPFSSTIEFDCFCNSDIFSEVKVLISSNSLSQDTQFSLEQEDNIRNFPKIVHKNDKFLTDILRLSPHEVTFRKPITVDFKFKHKASNVGTVQLLYNSASEDEQPRWRYITDVTHLPDDPTFTVHSDHVTIVFQHFCEVIVVETTEGVEFTLEELVFALKLDYDRALTHICLDVFKSCNFNQVHTNDA